MANFNEEFKKILKNLEENISDKEALETAKVEIFNLYNLFFDEITNLEQNFNNKIVTIAESQLHVEEEIKTINKSIKNIEKDIYMDDDMEDEECDVEIRCPYCNKIFTADMDELTGEDIICPECNNTIELDWGDECDGECDCCSHDEHDCNCCDEEDDDL